MVIAWMSNKEAVQKALEMSFKHLCQECQAHITLQSKSQHPYECHTSEFCCLPCQLSVNSALRSAGGSTALEHVKSLNDVSVAMQLQARARMAAAVRRRRKLHAAAMTVQRMWRGRQARKLTHQMRSAIAIQRCA